MSSEKENQEEGGIKWTIANREGFDPMKNSRELVGTKGFRDKHFQKRLIRRIEEFGLHGGSSLPEDCPTCEKTEAYHRPDCPEFTIEDARAIAKSCIEEVIESRVIHRDEIGAAWKSVGAARQEANKWKLKFLEVKHENNQLRKKVK